MMRLVLTGILAVFSYSTFAQNFMRQAIEVDPATVRIEAINGLFNRNRIEIYQGNELLIERAVYRDMKRLNFLKSYLELQAEVAQVLGHSVVLQVPTDGADMSEFYLDLLRPELAVRRPNNGIRLNRQKGIPLSREMLPRFIERGDEIVLSLYGLEQLKLERDIADRFSAASLNHLIEMSFRLSNKTLIFLNLESYWNGLPVPLQMIVPLEPVMENNHQSSSLNADIKS